jgi:hypothetical protein
VRTARAYWPVLGRRFALAGGHQVERSAAVEGLLEDREDEALQLAELGRVVEMCVAGEALLEALEQVDEARVGKGCGFFDLEIALQPGASRSKSIASTRRPRLASS